jgi:hypothetical protein
MSVAVAPGVPLLTVEVGEAPRAATALAVAVLNACTQALDGD